MRNVIVIASIALLAQACLFGKKDDPTTCRSNDECASKVCNLATYYCEPVGGGDSGQPQGGTVGTGGISGTGGIGGVVVDASGGVQPDAGTIVDAPTDRLVSDVAVDTRVPDAAGTCGVSGDCTDPTKAFCVAGACVGCQSADVNACVAPTPACDLTSGKCVGCTADSQCTTDPAKGFCVAGSCAGCGTAGATGCSARTDGKTTCASSGTIAGQCVACVADAQCTADPTKGFCVANVCTGCNAAGATGCTGRTDGKLVCATTGAVAGQCVACTADSQCMTDPAKGFCVANACTGCNTTGAAGCTARTDGKTTCAATGSFAGQCVRCTSNTQCSGTTPICATVTDTCRACATDSECTGIGPGVCMLDGHCAADTETVYVGALGTATCNESNAGAPQAPVCSLLAGVGLAKKNSVPVVLIIGILTAASTNIAVSSPLTIVGRNNATVAPTVAPGADCITITSGEIFLRNLTIQGTASPATGMGINAIAGTTLHMDTCAVINNPGGGILLNGAAFDLKNVTVNGNGPGQTTGGTPWGGIRVDALPSSGTTSLNLVTINTSKQIGLSCAGVVTGTGVFVSGSAGGIDVSNACSVTACAATSATCGVQSQPQ